MRNALDYPSIDDLSVSLANVVRDPDTMVQWNHFAAFNTNVDSLCTPALKEPRRGGSDRRTPRCFLRALNLRNVFKALLLSPGVQASGDHRNNRLRDGNIETIPLNLVAFGQHKPRNRGQEQEESEVSLQWKVKNTPRNFVDTTQGARVFTAEKLALAN